MTTTGSVPVLFLGSQPFTWSGIRQGEGGAGTHHFCAAARRDSATVVGAVIDLGLCLDLTTKAGISHVKDAYASLRSVFHAAGEALPVNSTKWPLRRLDCAVINHLHQLRRDQGEPPIQTVRGVFKEGDGIYPGTEITEKTHIQIAVVDPDCIKGVFRVRPADLRA